MSATFFDEMKQAFAEGYAEARQKADSRPPNPWWNVVLYPLAVLFVVGLVLWHAYAASILWGWFVVPLFGLPAVGVLEMAGLTLALRAVRPIHPRLPKVEYSAWDSFKHVCWVTSSPAVALCIGYIIRCCM